MLILLDTEQNLQIRVHRFVSYSRHLERTPEKSQVWPGRLYNDALSGIPYRDVFEKIETSESWINRIEFRTWEEQIEDEISYAVKLFDASIRRDCIFTVQKNLVKFYKYIIINSIKMISERLGYLAKRSKSATERNPEPIVIKFDRPMFKGDRWNEKFIEDMVQLKNVSVNELHTNPYVHISLLDYLDGSSYSIWVVSTDEIDIIPQVRATVASMIRLVNHIYEKVMEGETTNYVPIKIETTNSS